MGNRFIRYNRIVKIFDNIQDQAEIQKFLDDLIVNGYEIISYSEKQIKQTLTITILAGKIRNVL